MAKSGVLKTDPRRDAESRSVELAPASPEHRAVLDTTFRVTTPENISFQYQLAGPFRRVLAYFLDILISVVGYIVLAIAIYLLISFAVMPLANAIGGAAIVESAMGMLTGFILIGFFIVFWFYGAVMETYFNGQTLGKRWTQLRVLSADGHSIDGVQATLRNFFRWLDIAPIVSLATVFQLEGQVGVSIPTCLFGLIMMTINSKYQRIGDLVASTVVISESTKPQPHLAVFTDQRVESLSELIPATFIISPSMAKAIADYADQRRYLPFQRASEIAGHLARPLIQKFGLLPDTDHDLFVCALYFKTFSAFQGNQRNEKPVLNETGKMGQAMPLLVASAEVTQEESP